MATNLSFYKSFLNLFKFYNTNFPVTNLCNGIKIDLIENNKEFKIFADIPGANKEDIKVNFNNGVLSIEVKSKSQKEHKENGKVWKLERFYTQKSRSIYFDTQIDVKAISAKYENGVLELVLPKKGEDKPTRIQID